MVNSKQLPSGCVVFMYGAICVCDFLQGTNAVMIYLMSNEQLWGGKHHAGALAGSSLAFHALIVRELLWSAPRRDPFLSFSSERGGPLTSLTAFEEKRA